MRVHYPRTPHLPWSPGATADDVHARDLSGLAGRHVVVTEKMDGENTTLYRDGLHARSLDSGHHPSRAWVKALHSRIAARIPEWWRVSGENLFARHSIPYEDLDGYFYGFSIWDGEQCLDWTSTVEFFRGVGIPTPRVLWSGVFDAKLIQQQVKLDLSRQEGYVVRPSEGFAYTEFAERVAKWVRPSHVQTDTHWMHAEVVPNKLGARAPFWAVRSGVDVGAGELTGALSLETPNDVDDDALTDAYARLDAAGCHGNARLVGAAASLLHRRPRAALMADLATSLEMPTVRRIADVVGLAPRLHASFDDEHRRAGLARMAFGTDLGVLHAVAASTAADTAAAENVTWSLLFAEDSGLLPGSPVQVLRSACREAFAELPPRAADRCWGEARQLFAEGRIASPEEAVAATWRWRDGAFPKLHHMVGVSASGKSSTATSLAGRANTVLLSLDDLRTARGSRADQSANREVLDEALRLLDEALAQGADVVWDATSLTRQQRGLVDGVARRRNALVEHLVHLAPASVVRERNAQRAHPVPAKVLDAQLRRFDPPYPGEAHRAVYADTVGEDAAYDVLAYSIWEG
ncbi:kinase-like protein [Catenulispora acidiphila DSM 44928]|uniref:Kinase-like protein n=1 Tax=Catenulispora acidiphila (strain DSM 44928 / JCM 14897 / NBRC 102108 / NRRL B-24433 / ID139908) TaxID=479433 RepID=C7Q5C8_CATAD|nr:RNA ligase family protein [Catenulispora acidiphila]ACU75897.1 kinase-like protein [Catenulispora acidiphila DSM 44928]